MPAILRSKVALFALLGAFLIPISMSSLRGLTHVLTCEEEAATPFTLQVPPPRTGLPPSILSSTRISRGEQPTLCGGLELDMGARVGDDAGEVEMVLAITNNTEFRWQGTVTLVLGETSIPVTIGSVAAGATEREVVPITAPEGSTELAGSLLIGP